MLWFLSVTLDWQGRFVVALSTVTKVLHGQHLSRFSRASLLCPFSARWDDAWELQQMTVKEILCFFFCCSLLGSEAKFPGCPDSILHWCSWVRQHHVQW